ncbi:hypothetical protein N7495_003017 [Penicillium taxi]|uniref:uncharacterized protein n=1 Tax=Penicillium taxi TaxID=168475 RepID=UPI002545B274|nr:uncharacterized protein N7495_003017 [Penicillium taxi]KAJ5902489.1 hypothetical protein N7495_003017 [Penicillium taxi]
MAASGQAADLPRLINLIRTLTIPQLKYLLRNEGLPLAGLKAALQIRIISYLERLCASEGNPERYNALVTRIIASGVPGAMIWQADINPQLSNSASPTQHPTPPRNSMAPYSNNGVIPDIVHFKESPFYTIVGPLSQVIECKAREQTRDTVEFKIILSQTNASEMQNDPDMRVMIYCAADYGLRHVTKSDITFPHQVELKTNLDEVKANLRGLKNRPGTTQPADITDYLRKKPLYPNTVALTYALTNKKFFMVANLVRRHPIESLVEQLMSRKLISKEQVIREMKSRAEDSDIVATSSVMSLKCPLSTLRIQVPCRSVVCTHNQCFDASSFLLLQKQAPTWTCPVCSKDTSFQSLQVDQYVDEILKSTSVDVDQVVVEPNGDWSNPNENNTVDLGGETSDEFEDDLVEISEPGADNITATKKEPQDYASSVLLQQTPVQSREVSTPSSVAHTSSKKRSAAVIDLTGSDDDDEASPMPPVKRPALGYMSRGASSQDSYQPTASSPLNNRAYPP